MGLDMVPLACQRGAHGPWWGAMACRWAAHGAWRGCLSMSAGVPRQVSGVPEHVSVVPRHVSGGVGVHAGGKNEILEKYTRAISNFML